MLITVAVMASLWAVMVGLSAWLWDGATKPTTRIGKYDALMKDWSKTGLVDHFPKTIPMQARNVSLSAFPGFLQGSGWFQLRVTLPPKDVDAIQARAATQAVRACPPQCTTGVEDPEFWGVPRLIAGAEGDDFPPDFVVYAFETDGDWNHHTGKGIAVSKTRSEIVYWADP